MTLKDVVLQTLTINGYIFLYAIAMLFAGATGYLSACLAHELLHFVFGKRLIPYRDQIDLVHRLFVLTCGTGFLIVAIGLLFMRLARGAPHAYDQITVQVGTAVLGVVVFACICLFLVMVGAVAFWVVDIYRMKARDPRAVDEESRLLVACNERYYGHRYDVQELHDEDFEEESEADDDDRNNDDDYGKSSTTEDTKPLIPDGAWIEMSNLE